jgi:hypothetical protein
MICRLMGEVWYAESESASSIGPYRHGETLLLSLSRFTRRPDLRAVSVRCVRLRRAAIKVATHNVTQAAFYNVAQVRPD